VLVIQYSRTEEGRLVSQVGYLVSASVGIPCAYIDEARVVSDVLITSSGLALALIIASSV